MAKRSKNGNGPISDDILFFLISIQDNHWTIKRKVSWDKYNMPLISSSRKRKERTWWIMMISYEQLSKIC